MSTPSATPKPVLIFGVDSSGTAPAPLNSAPADSDDVSEDSEGLITLAFGYAWNPATEGWDRVRILELDTDGNSDTFEGVIAAAFGYGFNGASWDRIRTDTAVDDDITTASIGLLSTMARMFGFNGSGFDRVRVANVFHTGTQTAVGPTAIWTPGAGNFFRLMGGQITVAGTLAAAGVQVITLLDGATPIKTFGVPLGTTADSQGAAVITFDLGNGELSAAAANNLSIELSTAMATGGVYWNVHGTQGPTA